MKYRYEDFNDFDLEDMKNFLECKIKLKEITDDGTLEDIKDYLKELDDDYNRNNFTGYSNELIERAVDLLNNNNRYEQELKNKNYLSVALYDEFTFWQESMAQNDERFYSLTEEEIWEVIDKTIDDDQFTEEMWNCFDYYLSHNKKESA